jgi:hypothetical protein
MRQLDTVENQQLGYILDVNYPDMRLSRRALEQRDVLIVAQLEEVCNEPHS